MHRWDKLADIAFVMLNETAKSYCQENHRDTTRQVVLVQAKERKNTSSHLAL